MEDYAIRVISSGLCLEVRLNDVPVYINNKGINSTDENFVNEFMAEGNNELKLIVRPPYPLDEVPPTAQAVAELLSVERGDSVSDGEVLAQVVWPDYRTPVPPRSYPQITEGKEYINTEDYRSWRNAPIITLDNDTQKNILGLLRQLTDALDNRRIEDCISLLKIKVIERARAYHFDETEKLDQLRQSYSELMQHPLWGIEAWKENNAKIELLGNEKLVKITDSVNEYIIQSTDLGGIQLVIPTYVTCLENQWIIIR